MESGTNVQKTWFFKTVTGRAKTGSSDIAGYGKNRQVTVSGSGFVPALLIIESLDDADGKFIRE